MFSDFTIRELAKILCGDVECMPYLSGPKLVDLFNKYGARDTYGQGFPSRWSYTEDKLIELNVTTKIIKLIEEMVQPRRFLNFDYKVTDAVERINELISFDGCRLKDIRGTYKLYSDEPIVVQSETITTLEIDYVIEQIQKCDNKILQEDYDGAITNARTLIETIMLDIIHKYNTSYVHEGDLNKLYKEIKAILKLETKKGEYPDSIIQLLSGLTSIVNGIASVRNSMSDAHAKRYKPSKHHAKLAVNSAKTLSEFLIDSFIYQSKLAGK